MSADKKRKLIEKELIKLGINDKETLEKLIEEVDEFAKLIIKIYKNTQLKKL